MRLLLSSAQVEYIVYYLHAMGLTRAPIPLPSSEYLIREADLRNCSPDVYRDAEVLKRSIKVRPRPRRRRARRARCADRRAERLRDAGALCARQTQHGRRAARRRAARPSVARGWACRRRRCGASSPRSTCSAC